jgi:hypothetical protein
VAANGTDWTFNVGISGLTDGAYDISVRATDTRGVDGPTFTIPMTLIRSTPAAPAGLIGGPNKVFVGGVLTPVMEFEWRANPERNVIGYRVYDANNSLVCPASSATLSLKLSCVNLAATEGTYKVVALYRNAADVVTEGPPSTISTTDFSWTYYFQKSTANTTDSTTCLNSDRLRDMARGYTGANPEESYSRVSSIRLTANFCSPAFPAAANMLAGTTSVAGYVTNASGATCDITATLYKNGTTSLGSATITVPAGAPLGLRNWTFPSAATSLAAGARLNLRFTWQSVKGCDTTSLFYGGTVNRSAVTVPSTTTAPPNPITGLSAVSPGDGTTVLSWSAPSGGTPVAFYRIYRDGKNYTDRLDTTGSGTDTTYVDDPGGTTHTYYVTAVGDNLAESTMAGPVVK